MDFLEDLIGEVEDRKEEITDLEKAALQACRQVSGPQESWCYRLNTNMSTQLQELLSLKQQQAGIVAAQAALDNADVSIDQAQESIQQGKAIMAFTIMTIIFVSNAHDEDIREYELTQQNIDALGILHVFLRDEQRPHRR